MSRSIYVLTVSNSVNLANIMPVVERWKEKIQPEFGPLVVLLEGMKLIRLDNEVLKECTLDQLKQLIEERNSTCADLVDISQENQPQEEKL